MRFTLPRLLSVGAIIFLVGTIFFYAYYQSRALVSGPQINVESPENGTTTASSMVLVGGTAQNAKELVLNGRPIFIDLAGRFAEPLLLMDGYNIIELTARDAQGRTVRKTLELVYQPEYHGITL